MQSRSLPPGYEEAPAYAQGKKDGIAEAQIIDRARDRELEQQKASAQRSWAEVEQLRKQVASLEAEAEREQDVPGEAEPPTVFEMLDNLPDGAVIHVESGEIRITLPR